MYIYWSVNSNAITLLTLFHIYGIGLNVPVFIAIPSPYNTSFNPVMP